MRKHIQRFIPAVVVLSVVGGVLYAQAALPHLSFEAEDGVLSGAVVKGADAAATNGGYIQFNQPSTGQQCPSGQVGTPPNCFNANAALGVNAGNVVSTFDNRMLGIGLANWTFTKGWGKPFVGQVQGLRQAIGALNPGIIRYAGGLWANYVGFDRNRTQMTAYTNWTHNGRTYSFNYGTDELADLDAFAKSVNADVMIQVNISQNDPQMWADLVRYAKERGFTSFKYYELGNELDLETMQGSSAGISPDEYASRARAYQEAMLAVDPNIKIVGGVPASASDIVRTGWGCCGNNVSQYVTKGLAASRAAGRDWGGVAVHWYQGDNDNDHNDLFRWNWNPASPSTSPDWWTNSYTRIWSEQVGPWVRSAGMNGYSGTELGISELGPSSHHTTLVNGTHIAALWYSDVLGRLAYNGIDWVTQWDSYASQGESFSLLYPNNDLTTTPTIHARPTYYAYLMYSKFFGDQMVQSSTYDPSKVSVWASRDSDDPGKLKLRITNLTGSSIAVPVALNGFTATSGKAYVMSSTNPLDRGSSSITSNAPTTINGQKINAMDVNGSLANIAPQNISVSGTYFNYTIPAYSSAAVILEGSY